MKDNNPILYSHLTVWVFTYIIVYGFNQPQINILREYKRLTRSWEREVFPLFSAEEVTNFAGNYVARQPLTASVGFETRYVCSLIEEISKWKHKTGKNNLLLDGGKFAYTMRVINLWASSKESHGSKAVLMNIKLWKFFEQLTYTAIKFILPFRKHQSIKPNYSMASGETCVTMLK